MTDFLIHNPIYISVVISLVTAIWGFIRRMMKLTIISIVFLLVALAWLYFSGRLPLPF